ncbi:MAG: RNA polymerase sigma factor [Chloroflexota bacterium]
MRADGDLLKRLKSGDQQTWSQFYGDWVQPLYNFIRSNGVYDQSDIEEVLGETWLAAPKAIKNFDGQNATLKTFLFSLARRKIADHWRKHKPVQDLPESISFSHSTQESLELREVLARIPDHERQALILRYLEGFSVQEIANTLGRTYKGTESLLSRARKRLEEELNGKR